MTGPVWDVFEAQLADEREAARLARARRAPRRAPGPVWEEPVEVVRELAGRVGLVDDLIGRLRGGEPDPRHARLLAAVCREPWLLEDVSPERYAATIASSLDELLARRQGTGRCG